MLTIVIASAGLLSPPVMSPVIESYPSKPMRNGQSAAALIEVVVDPRGKPVNCKTLTVFGNETLGNDICKLQGRAKYKPALTEAGEPTYGIIRAFIKYILPAFEQGREINRFEAPGITFQIVGAAVAVSTRVLRLNKALGQPGARHIVVSPDVTFDVQSLPGVDGNFRDERVTVAVDSSGKVTHCTAPSQPEADATVSSYAIAACQQLEGMEISDPLMIDKQPVGYVRPLEVRFAIATPSGG